MPSSISWCDSKRRRSTSTFCTTAIMAMNPPKLVQAIRKKIQNSVASDTLDGGVDATRRGVPDLRGTGRLAEAVVSAPASDGHTGDERPKTTRTRSEITSACRSENKVSEGATAGGNQCRDGLKQARSFHNVLAPSGRAAVIVFTLRPLTFRGICALLHPGLRRTIRTRFVRVPIPRYSHRPCADITFHYSWPSPACTGLYGPRRLS